jgi:hypothetical protein
MFHLLHLTVMYIVAKEELQGTVTNSLLCLSTKQVMTFDRDMLIGKSIKQLLKDMW